MREAGTEKIITLDIESRLNVYSKDTKLSRLVKAANKLGLQDKEIVAIEEFNSPNEQQLILHWESAGEIHEVD